MTLRRFVHVHVSFLLLVVLPADLQGPWPETAPWGASVAHAAPASEPPAILLNEVLYDPDGADGGLEFVELVARVGGDPAASLEGWVLETGNGAQPGDWTVAWVGGVGDRLAGGLFLIGKRPSSRGPM